MKSDGTPWRPIVHIRDIIGADDRPFWRLREKWSTIETFNVGQTTENYRISELADMVEETVPGCRIEFAPGGGPDKRCYRVDCGKIKPPGARLSSRSGMRAKERRSCTTPIAPWTDR